MWLLLAQGRPARAIAGLFRSWPRAQVGRSAARASRSRASAEQPR
jgi:hypothetical protein